jgi:REP element-mobilizing transposase RayT
LATFEAAVTRTTPRRGLWQRGFYEHVVRDDHDLERIRDYIAKNPIRWALDRENPTRRRS